MNINVECVTPKHLKKNLYNKVALKKLVGVIFYKLLAFYVAKGLINLLSYHYIEQIIN